MSFDWSTYLALARELAVGGDEAKCRSSVSRAYYSAFCSAREWLRNACPALSIPRHGEAHFFVQSCFQKDPVSTRVPGEGKLKVQIAGKLKDLRNSRTDADYENKLPGMSHEVAELAVRRADAVLDLLKKLQA